MQRLCKDRCRYSKSKSGKVLFLNRFRIMGCKEWMAFQVLLNDAKMDSYLFLKELMMSRTRQVKGGVIDEADLSLS